MQQHICQEEFLGVSGMRDVYKALGLLATSENADVVLIRSHIAYWSGVKEADRAVIKPSRGHTYRVNGDRIVRIRDYYDHREGITGWVAA